MNLIILDFDGVMTSIESGTHFCLLDDLSYKPCKKLVDRVKRLCDETDSKIMISSNWRRYEDDEFYIYRQVKFYSQIPKLRRMLKGYLYSEDLPYERGKRKGESLRDWLKANKKFAGNFVILDDAVCEKFGELRYKKINRKFIQVDPQYGFSEENYETAKKILASKDGI